MSLVGGNDGYTNIFGKPKPAPGWERPLNTFVDSKYFPMVAGALVAGGAAAWASSAAGGGAAGAAAASEAKTAVTIGSGIVGAIGSSSLTIPKTSIPQQNVNLLNGDNMADTTQANTTATNPQVPAASPNVVIVPSPQANAGLMWVGLAAIFFLLYKGKR